MKQKMLQDCLAYIKTEERFKMIKNDDIDKVLFQLGVLTKNSDGSLRNVYEVLNDISCAFSTLDTAQQLLLAGRLVGLSAPTE